MKYRICAADALYGRMLELEMCRLGLTAASVGKLEYSLLIAESQTDLKYNPHIKAVILIDCGLLSAMLPESVKLLILNRPFSLKELREFVSALASDDTAPTGDGILLSPEEMSVTIGDEMVHLTKREYMLFSYLHEHPYTTVTREELLKQLWKDETARDTNVVDVYVKFIRTKLDEKLGVRLIRAVRGVGYTFRPDDRLAEITGIKPKSDDTAESEDTPVQENKNESFTAD